MQGLSQQRGDDIFMCSLKGPSAGVGLGWDGAECVCTGVRRRSRPPATTTHSEVAVLAAASLVVKQGLSEAEEKSTPPVIQL